MLLVPSTDYIHNSYISTVGHRHFHNTAKMGPFAVVLCLNVMAVVVELQHAPSSPFPEEPFVTIWNAPSAHCQSRYGVDLDLGMFSIVQNQDQSFMGDSITLFYSGNFGMYPSYSPQDTAVNGGVPQNANLEEQLRVAKEEMLTKIPDPDFQGLGVIDWESWRPIWERNWGSKRVYQQASETLVRSSHPDWTPAQIEAVARKKFEEAAREWMVETLRLGLTNRPQGLWGYYGFPNCYNYIKDNVDYSGECPPIEIERNNELSWLWNVSTALYPSIYLSQKRRGLDRDVLLFTQHRILEAMRVASQVTPVFPYSRFVYTYSLDFLPQEHLVYTIGESAALGSAGIVLWGDKTYAISKASCIAVKDYIDETLGHYLVNVTTAATFCSQSMCSSRGRCQRIDPKSQAYFHLDPTTFEVVAEKKPEGGNNYRVLGQMSPRQLLDMKSQFQCKCYAGWVGKSCSRPKQG